MKYLFLTILLSSGVVCAQLSQPGARYGQNKIQNGAMILDQRQEGASVTVNQSRRLLDRWLANTVNTAGTFSIVRDTVVPSGFSNSLKATVVSNDAVLDDNDHIFIKQHIEGTETADLNFGLATAKPMTLSFWVRSSKIGIYSVGFTNATDNRTLAAEYTINAANTWEKKKIVVRGDTSGTWANTRGTFGLVVYFNLMVGSARQQAAGAWTATDDYGSTNQVNWMATAGETFYLTGVQLESGTQATDFEHRPFALELLLCQRFYQKTYSIGAAVGGANTTGAVSAFGVTTASTTTLLGNTKFTVPMFNTPAVQTYSTAGTANKLTRSDTDADVGTSPAAFNISQIGFRYVGGTDFIAATMHTFHYTADSLY